MDQAELTAELRIQRGVLESISRITKRILRDMRSIAQESAKMQPLMQGPWTGKLPDSDNWTGTKPWFPSDSDEGVADAD